MTINQSYEILGVDSSNTLEQIKSAYRKLAIKYHPDKNLDGNQEFTNKFKEISAAYDFLTKVKSGVTSSLEFDESKFKFAGEFESILKAEFGDIFSSGFSKYFSNNNKNIEITKILQTVSLNLKEYYGGCTKKISYSRRVLCDCDSLSCDSCYGDGFILEEVNSILGKVKVKKKCADCDGIGSVSKKDCEKCKCTKSYTIDEEFDITIPNYENRTRLVFKEKGHLIPYKNIYDDLEIFCKLEDRTFFDDSGNLEATVSFTYEELCAGGNFEIETHDGIVYYELEPKPKIGSKIIITNKGLVENKNLTIIIDLKYQ
jgi:molecular chaperone DnaJ